MLGSCPTRDPAHLSAIEPAARIDVEHAFGPEMVTSLRPGRWTVVDSGFDLGAGVGEHGAHSCGTVGRGRSRRRGGRGDGGRFVPGCGHRCGDLVVAVGCGLKFGGVLERLPEPGFSWAMRRSSSSTWTRWLARELSIRPGRFSSRVMCPSSIGLPLMSRSGSRVTTPGATSTAQVRVSPSVLTLTVCPPTSTTGPKSLQVYCW
jgi:hypothetical protein